MSGSRIVYQCLSCGDAYSVKERATCCNGETFKMYVHPRDLEKENKELSLKIEKLNKNWHRVYGLRVDMSNGLKAENKELREFFNKVTRSFKTSNGYDLFTDEVEKLLNEYGHFLPIHKTSPDTVDKSTDNVDKELNKYELQDLVDTALINDDGSSTYDKDWSPWYPFVGELDFDDSIEMEVEFVPIQVLGKPAAYDPDKKQYRVKLKGVKLYEYDVISNGMYKTDGGFIPVNGILGHDPGNKIIIVKDKEPQ